MPRVKHSKASFANTVDRVDKVKSGSEKAMWVYVRARYNAAKTLIAAGHEMGPEFRKELQEISKLLEGAK